MAPVNPAPHGVRPFGHIPAAGLVIWRRVGDCNTKTERDTMAHWEEPKCLTR